MGSSIEHSEDMGRLSVDQRLRAIKAQLTVIEALQAQLAPRNVKDQVLGQLQQILNKRYPSNPQKQHVQGPQFTLFFHFPLEIRLQIYRYVLDIHSNLHLHTYMDGSEHAFSLIGHCPKLESQQYLFSDHLPFFSTCRDIYNEAMPLFWQEAKFTFRKHEECVPFLEAIGEERRSLIKHLSINVDKELITYWHLRSMPYTVSDRLMFVLVPKWKSLEHLMKLISNLRDLVVLELILQENTRQDLVRNPDYGCYEKLLAESRKVNGHFVILSKLREMTCIKKIRWLASFNSQDLVGEEKDFNQLLNDIETKT
ncbi:MAG: hypothetical protein M1834_001133 [Cirrosporium novae-zelandiae]|nr:MAG: hypothetical protein M1834_001133 [Cirrosporium novae-zelandiae]